MLGQTRGPESRSQACAGSQLQGGDLQWLPQTALTVVMAAKGYPGPYGKGSIIRGLDQVQGAKVGPLMHALHPSQSLHS